MNIDIYLLLKMGEKILVFEHKCDYFTFHPEMQMKLDYWPLE